ncbi:MAG: BlaI/MecI/CopY family transcriptional regulator [Lachnoclostridium sp.]|jgi:BlaI family penicillinase repressor|nr:BlaI/MecI/CopY family transcriptional regulator [Lachnoclostridium sp.]
MGKTETTPSESEWIIMETIWASDVPLTSSEVIHALQEHKIMTPKMVRVLMNRLCQKNILNFTVDKRDARIYHYYSVRSKEECLKEKSRKFVDNYFSGNQANAMAALLQNFTLTDEQIEELEAILEKSKDDRKERG